MRFVRTTYVLLAHRNISTFQCIGIAVIDEREWATICNVIHSLNDVWWTISISFTFSVHMTFVQSANANPMHPELTNAAPAFPKLIKLYDPRDR